MSVMPTTYAVSGCNDTNVVIGGPVDAIFACCIGLSRWSTRVLIVVFLETSRSGLGTWPGSDGVLPPRQTARPPAW